MAQISLSLIYQKLSWGILNENGDRLLFLEKETLPQREKLREKK